MILKAHVMNGRIVSDEPTELPEGKVASIVFVQEEDDSLDCMTPEERRQLDAALDAGLAATRAGQIVEGDEVVRRLLARNEQM